MHSPNKPPVASDAKGRAEPPGFEYQFLEDSAPRTAKAVTSVDARVAILCDGSAALDFVAEAQRLIAISPLWLRWLVAHAFQGGQESFNLLCIDRDCDSASSASDVRVLAQPSDRFRLLVAALRAGNGDREVGIVFEREFELEHGALQGNRSDVEARIVAEWGCHVPGDTTTPAHPNAIPIGPTNV